MIPAEILQKVKLIEIKTRNIVDNIFGGEYHSAFKGMGMEFAEVREYVPGDDIRNIDWNVTARAGKPFIKKFDEERELTMILMVDVSASGFFGTGHILKSDIIVELSSILSFSAIKNNDKVGLILFSDKIEKYIPPKKGKSHVLRVIRELIFYKAEDQQTNINQAIDFIQRVIKRKSVVFLISDFIDNDFEKSMKLLNNKHDLISVKITDPSENNFPNIGLVKLHDSESKETFWIDSSTSALQELMANQNESKNNMIISFFKKNKIDYININSEKGYIDPLITFFNERHYK